MPRNNAVNIDLDLENTPTGHVLIADGAGGAAFQSPPGGEGSPVGSILLFGDSNAPTGFLVCDGASYATASYPELHNVIGYTYGGSGANFNVPNISHANGTYMIKYENIALNSSFEELKSHNNFTGSGRVQRTNAIQTTDNTTTDILTEAINDNTSVWFSVRVIARYENTGTEKNFWFQATGGVRRNNGSGATLIGTAFGAQDDEGSPGYSVTIDTNGNSLRIRVTGGATETVNWAATIEYQGISLST